MPRLYVLWKETAVKVNWGEIVLGVLGWRQFIVNGVFYAQMPEQKPQDLGQQLDGSLFSSHHIRIRYKGKMPGLLP